jgi:hypothetical protein
MSGIQQPSRGGASYATDFSVDTMTLNEPMMKKRDTAHIYELGLILGTLRNLRM